MIRVNQTHPRLPSCCTAFWDGGYPSAMPGPPETNELVENNIKSQAFMDTDMYL